MAWIQLRLNATASSAEEFADLLQDFGALSVTFLDAKDVPVFEPLPGETRLWGETDVMGLWRADAELAPLEALLAEDFPELIYKIETLEDKDWEREWMDNFHPMRFGERLWICPSWRDAPDPTAVNVLLDPGLAFGTGTHPTTALCLEWLDSQELTGKTIVDFGCGSGILAVAALKLGAARAIGIDIDPQALEASAENARRNGVDDRLTLFLAKDAPAACAADVVVANILAGPLVELAPQICAHLRPGGALALSGILDTQAESVAAAYAKRCQLNPPTLRAEWARLDGTQTIG